MKKKATCLFYAFVMSLFFVFSQSTQRGLTPMGCNVVQAADSYDFTAIDGTTVNSTAKAPKQLNVIVFGRPMCLNTNNALKSISDSQWVNDEKINFIYADGEGNDKAVITEFSKKFSSKITFCYGKNVGAGFRLSGASGQISYPIIVYIDNSGNVLKASTGSQSTNQIYLNICDCMGYEKPEVEYPVQTLSANKSVEARKMLSMINAFRTGNDAWYWNSDNSTKTVYNTSADNKVEPLTYDYQLEKVAIQRAKELTVYYSHSRPDGSSFDATYPQGVYRTCGENIAYGQTSAETVFVAFREDDKNYSGQGHRRNMLNPEYNAVGFACFEVEGVKCWVQEFGYLDTFTSANTTPINYSDEIKKYDVNLLEDINRTYQPTHVDKIELGLNETKTMDLSMYFKSQLKPYSRIFLPTTITVKDTSIVSVSKGVVKGLKTGKTTIKLSAKISAKNTFSVDVPVEVVIVDNGKKYSDASTMNAKDIKKNVLVADKVSGGKYKITNVTKKGSKVSGGTVTYARPFDVNAKTATVKPTVKIGGATFKVTEVDANAFKGCGVTKIVIGKNVTKIAKNAFNGCKNLKLVIIKSTKLKSIGKNAFKGVNAKIKIKVPKKCLNKYKKMIKKAGAPKKAKVTK